MSLKLMWLQRCILVFSCVYLKGNWFWYKPLVNDFSIVQTDYEPLINVTLVAIALDLSKITLIDISSDLFWNYSNRNFFWYSYDFSDHPKRAENMIFRENALFFHEIPKFLWLHSSNERKYRFSLIFVRTFDFSRIFPLLNSRNASFCAVKKNTE